MTVKIKLKTSGSNITKKTLKFIEKITGRKLTSGKLLWSIRKSDNISQMDFANTLKISRQYLRDIENERKLMSPKLAANCAEILGYSKTQFIRLALQDLVNRDGLNIEIKITLKNIKKVS